MHDTDEQTPPPRPTRATALNTLALAVVLAVVGLAFAAVAVCAAAPGRAWPELVAELGIDWQWQATRGDRLVFAALRRVALVAAAGIAVVSLRAAGKCAIEGVKDLRSAGRL